MTNLVAGENILSVEVHQFGAASSDIVFGSEVSLVRALASETSLRIARADDGVCLSWDGAFLTLQQAAPVNPTWADVPGPIRTSPYCITNPAGSVFYRLRN